MKTTMNHEKEIRGIKSDIFSLEEIAIGGSIIPLIVEDKDQEVNEVTFCERISGGQAETDFMPNNLSLTRLKKIDSELHSYSADYIQKPNFDICKTQDGETYLKNVFSGVGLETSTGDYFGICMRDSGFEFQYHGIWYQAKDGKVNILSTLE